MNGDVEITAKKGKKSKKKDYDEDDIAKELEELALETNGEVPDSIKSKVKIQNVSILVQTLTWMSRNRTFAWSLTTLK